MNGVRGFTLTEFVVAIVFIGVVLGPMLVFVNRIHDLNNALGQQARREAWHSFTDQAVTAGVDPTRAAALSAALNLAVPAMATLAVVQGNTTAEPGVPRVVSLQARVDATVAEPRITAGGFQLGAGATLAPRGTPAAPLLPVVMPIPSVSPTDGTVLAVMSLASSGAGAPSSLTIQATAAAGATIRGVMNQPAGSFQGSGSAQYRVTAIDLLQGTNGVVWSEYPGNVSVGDQAVSLGDGRTRWLVTTAERRLQIYEPSPQIHFAYQLDVGPPVLVRDAVEDQGGSTVSIDYATYTAVQSGASHVRIDFPTTVKAAFGSAWPTLPIGFQWTFGGNAGPFSGEFGSFFQPTALALWSDSIAVQAMAVLPSGAVTSAAAWTIARVKSALDAPVMSSGPDATGLYAAGTIQFSAPVGPGGAVIGRLSFNGGSDVSTGDTLSLSVSP